MEKGLRDDMRDEEGDRGVVQQDYSPVMAQTPSSHFHQAAPEGITQPRLQAHSFR